MKIDFLVSQNPYQSTYYFSEKFSEALKRAGVDVRIFDISGGCFYKAFYTIIKDPPDFTCSFSDIKVGQNTLGEMWKIPHLSFLIDPAIYFLHQFKEDYSLITCVDKEDCQFVKKCGFNKVSFLPHGVDRDLKEESKKRTFDLVFLGTCTDYEKIRSSWKKRFSLKDAKHLENAAERVLSPEGISSLQALLDLGVEGNLPALHHELDLYIGGKDRVELARAMKGFSLHVWGKGPWKKYLPDAILHRPVSFLKTLDIMRSSKVVLNSSPRFKQGSHERIFHAPACGALLVTGDNKYIREHFKAQECLVTYSHGEWEKCRPHIQRALENEEWRKEFVANHKKRIMEAHTWDHRAETLLKWIR